MMVPTMVAMDFHTVHFFNVLENGQPRWQALPTQIVDEASMGTLSCFHSSRILTTPVLLFQPHPLARNHLNVKQQRV